MPQISVIVPVYNTEQYLRQCLDSILCQTFSDFELILVDDGSSDNSGQICDEYALLDQRITVIHKVNCGVSSARNSGLKCALGQYIVFVDADDLINIDYFENLTSVHADLVLSSFDDYWPDTKKRIEYQAKYGEFIIKNENDIVAYLKGGYAPGFVWGKLFLNQIIKKYKICFDETQKHSEDILFIGDYIKHINYIYKLNYCGYHHCQYKSDTLSNVAMKKPLITRMDWWRKALFQFEGYPIVQKYYAEMFLYLFEKEVQRIAISNLPLDKEKKVLMIC